MIQHRRCKGRMGRARRAWRNQPFSLALSVTMFPVGLMAMILGDDVSKALSNITADYVSQMMGTLMFVGSIIALYGIVRPGVTMEVVGLSLIAGGIGIYGVGVIMGLGMGGMVAGPIAIAVSVAIVRRVQLVLNIAQRLELNG